MSTKNIALSLFFTIISFGIYGLYWLYCIADSFEKEHLSENLGISPGMFILVSIATCGIFNIYAFYKWGHLTAELMEKHGKKHDENRVIIYLIFSLFGLSIINLCIIQDDFNKIYADFNLPQKAPQNQNDVQNPTPASYR